MKLINLTKWTAIGVLCVTPLRLMADVWVPAIISDNMVVQTNEKVRFWGKADVGEKIHISTSWDQKGVTTTAKANGQWEIYLHTGECKTNQTIWIKGKNTITIHNVLVGEVWLCSGQSNMEFPVARNTKTKWHTGMIDEEEQLQNADFPEMRLFRIEKTASPNKALDDCQGQWLVCNVENVRTFSAIGFVFGREIHTKVNRPVGMIQAAWGGTPAEAWTSPAIIKNDKFYTDVRESLNPQFIAQTKDKHKIPGSLWNGMINPIIGYTLKGFIWYQGESNQVRASKYAQTQAKLIHNWRKQWKQPDAPFYYVQIAPQYHQAPLLREQQTEMWQSGQIKNVGMVVITDVGDSLDIHPRNKQVPGERLARWALAKQYNMDIDYQSPVLNDFKINDNGEVLLSFKNAKTIKTYDNKEVRGVLLSGSDSLFYPAQVKCDGNKLIVSSPLVKNPVAVRYGWGYYTNVNLCNEAGLPVTPFRTDTYYELPTWRWFAHSERIRFPMAWQLDHGKRLFFGYAQGVGCCAMLKVWKQTGDESYFNYVEEWADSLINEKGKIHKYDMSAYNIDFINSGKTLFELYKETKKEKYKLAMDLLVKQMKNHPRTLEGGYWHKLCYQHQIWLDGLYMASPFLAQYGATFNQPEWIDEAVKQIRICHKHTYDTNTGLYHHAWDESKSQLWADKETGHSPNFWGRSIGWWFMALVDVLDYIPEKHEGRSDIISYIKGLADTLPKYQDKNGLWYQVIDQPTREGNFPEASVTAQCMYAYAKAVNKGYIDDIYRQYAEKAYNGLMNKLIGYNADGTLTLTRCCQVGGLGGNPYRDGSFEYYINEKMRDNDAKATGPFIMGCIELGK